MISVIPCPSNASIIWSTSFTSIQRNKFPLSAAGSDIDTEKLGNAIGDYIQLIDAEIKQFFSDIDFPEKASENMKRIYADYIDKAII